MRTNLTKLCIKTINNYYFVDFYQVFNSDSPNKLFFLNETINFKKRFILFKNIRNLKKIFLKKLLFFKFNFFKKQITKINFFRKKKTKIRNFNFFKKKLFFYMNNRDNLKIFLKLNKKKNFFINKFIKKILKINFKNFFNIFEFSLKNILIKSNFFLNQKDFFFFLNHGYIYINKKKIFNQNLILQKNDLIEICFDKYFFFLYRSRLNFFSKSIYRYNNFYKIKRASLIKNNKHKKNKLKKHLGFVSNFYFYKNDIPTFLEVDYLSMSILILYKNINLLNFNYINLKLFNVFLKRVYNWKYII